MQVLNFGARAHLFIYFFIILLKYVAANAFGIWNLRNTAKSVTTELSDTQYYSHYIDINICLLLDAFLNITSFKAWHEYI